MNGKYYTFLTSIFTQNQELLEVGRGLSGVCCLECVACAQAMRGQLSTIAHTVQAATWNAGKYSGIQGSPQNLGTQGHQINESMYLFYIFIYHILPHILGVYVCVREREEGRGRERKLGEWENVSSRLWMPWKWLSKIVQVWGHQNICLGINSPTCRLCYFGILLNFSDLQFLYM